MRRHSLPVLIFLFLVPCLASPQGEPLGPEFRVNTVTSLGQRYPSVASGADEFLVVWENRGDGYGVSGQRFDGGGNPLGTEFRVNTSLTSSGVDPAVAANASGAFVVVWEHIEYPLPPPSFGTWSTFGQRYAASGTPVGSAFRVNGPVGDAQSHPVVAVAPSGAFMVVWHRAFGQAPPGPGDVKARVYDSSGLPEGPEFRVNTYTPGYQFAPSVAADPTGNFVVVWGDYPYGPPSVLGRRFAPSGAPLGFEFRVNTYTTAFAPAVVTDSSGNFTVTWEGGGAANTEIFGQRFAADGGPLGPQFQVNTTTTGQQIRPGIAADGAGNFVIVWLDYPQPGQAGNVLGQRYSSLGAPSGPEFRVNTATVTALLNTPSVASAFDGTFLVTWHLGPFGQEDIFGQRFGGIFPVKLQDFQAH